ncbi:hypothetical protein TNCV_2104851 [Trichonephila clavipes]|nr:hypothetical protein TNCV_2104851 [Trichonephila clavipes]
MRLLKTFSKSDKASSQRDKLLTRKVLKRRQPSDRCMSCDIRSAQIRMSLFVGGWCREARYHPGAQDSVGSEGILIGFNTRGRDGDINIRYEKHDKNATKGELSPIIIVPIAELAERWTELPQVSDESRSFFIVHTGYFSNIPKCIKAEFIASWACSQSSVVSSSQR